MTNSIPDGTRNIRVVYNKGVSSRPEEINELCALYAGIRAYASITGASYDEMTTYGIGAKNVTVGEEVVLWYMGKMTSRSGNEYRNFRVYHQAPVK